MRWQTTDRATARAGGPAESLPSSVRRCRHVSPHHRRRSGRTGLICPNLTEDEQGCHRMEQYGNAIVVVPIVSVIVLAIAVAATLAARASMRRAREAARASPTGSAGAPPMTAVPGDRQRSMWEPQDGALQGWTWSGGRTQPPDVLSGRHAVYDTVVAREISGTFHGRAAFSQVRRLQRLPIVPRSAPHTHWSTVTGLRGDVRLPRFFALTEQPEIVARTMTLDAAEGLEKTIGALGRRTVLWCEPPWTELLVEALRPMLERGTPEAYLFASDASTLYVCASRGEDESAVLQRIRLGHAALESLETLLEGDPRS